ncbi:MAG TPA: hypothetical protein VLN25_00685 [Burkholderiaceae bacterium]|nr:hypothetical protein [Burkholderiaceae bacterium]
MSITPRRGCRAMRLAGLALLAALTPLSSAMAQSEGGLYIAGDAGFKFQQAAERGLAQNPGGRRFFVLSVPPQTSAMKKSAPAPLAQLRDRVIAGNGVLLVCQRDIDKGRIDPAELVPGVVAVRGWPEPGSNEISPGTRYFADEDTSRLPAANEALRRLRSTCS